MSIMKMNGSGGRSCALFILLLCLAMMSTAAHGRTLRGAVKSASDSTAVAGADCTLSFGGTVVGSARTDASGAFSLATQVRGKARLEVAKEGFNPTYILIDAASATSDLGTIYLNEATMLGEVTVSTQAVRNSDGRTIVFPSSADVNASHTSLSLFAKLPLPGLQTNPINRSLTVDGGSPMILIDGVPSTLDDVNALSPANIAKVEFSRLTPVRYADKGYSGLLSITLKQRVDGGEVYLWARSALNTTFVDANLRASYHQGPSQFTFFYIPSWRNYQDVHDYSLESYVAPDFRIRLESSDRNPFNYNTNSIYLKYNYKPDAKTLLSATFSINPNANSSRALGSASDSRSGEYEFNKHRRGRSMSPSLDLFFRRDFNSNNSLELQVVGTLSSDKYLRDNTFVYSDGRREDYVVDVKSRRRSLISEASFVHQFSERTSLSTGIRNTLSHSVNTYIDTDYKPVLTENYNYVYARLGQRVGKVFFSVGTGAQLYWIKNHKLRRHFVRNLTSAQLSWNPNDHWNVGGSFYYNPSIPSLSDLTDYAQQTTPNVVANGNPDLKSAASFQYRVNVSYTIPHLTLYYAAALSDVHNSAMTDISYIGNELFLSRLVNGSSRRFSHDFEARLNGIYGFGAALWVRLAHYRAAIDAWSHTLTSVDGSLSVWWNKGPFTLSYWYRLPGKSLSGTYVRKDENGNTLSLSYKPNKHWTLTAAWMYMFVKRGTQYPSWSYSEVNPSYTDRYIRDNSNMVVLSATYTADFGSIFRAGKRSLNNSDSGSAILRN